MPRSQTPAGNALPRGSRLACAAVGLAHCFRAIIPTGETRPAATLATMFFTFSIAVSPSNRWIPSGGGPPAESARLRKFRKKFRSKLVSISHSRDVEPRVFQRRHDTPSRRCQRAHTGHLGPRHRINKFFITLSHDIVETKVRTGLQYAVHFGKELRFILDIHAYVEHDSGVETGVFKRHRQRAAALKFHSLRQPHPRAQHLARFDKFGRQVDTRNAAIQPVSEKTGRSAQSGAPRLAHADRKQGRVAQSNRRLRDGRRCEIHPLRPDHPP